MISVKFWSGECQWWRVVCAVVRGVALASVQAGCSSGTTQASSYTIGGTLSGLAPGQSVTLQNNEGDSLRLRLDGSLTFPTTMHVCTLVGNLTAGSAHGASTTHRSATLPAWSSDRRDVFTSPISKRMNFDRSLLVREDAHEPIYC